MEMIGLTCSRRANLHFISDLKSPLPSTFRSSQLALTSAEVRSRVNHLQDENLTKEANEQLNIPTLFLPPCQMKACLSHLGL